MLVMMIMRVIAKLMVRTTRLLLLVMMNDDEEDEEDDDKVCRGHSVWGVRRGLLTYDPWMQKPCTIHVS